MEQPAALAAAHVGDEARLLVERLAVEDLGEQRLAVGEVAAVGCGADPHVEGAVDVPLWALRFRVRHHRQLAAIKLRQLREQRQVGGDATEVEAEGTRLLACLGPDAGVVDPAEPCQ
jgi:hypothetical protein